MARDPSRPFPTGPLLDSLCEQLADRAAATQTVGPWQSGVFQAFAESGCLAGWIAPADGGTAAAEPAIMDLLVAVASRCLTSALALTQWASAVRILGRADADTRQRLLPDLAAGRQFTTVGISQLTTSRQHLARPAVSATHGPDGWRLTGTCPWVTGADSVQTIVTGAVATLPSGEAKPLFFAIDTASLGVMVEPPMEMLALSGSRTSCVRLDQVPVVAEIPPAGPTAGQTGGLGTTALALGSIAAALELIDREADGRQSLAPVVAELRREADALGQQFRQATRDGCDASSRNSLRQRANALVTRSAQAALTASKGAGFVVGHPAERLLRESMFFLVWSCPQPVTESLLCDLAGLAAD
jgi:alkylation response protein AidB-like acyl-CoA dehydrogenase